ncbi:ABC-type transporter, integral membrane subunit [Gemmatirosa kalamazoonensis]|uniref:ABC-type transporter, integral membrane subunit n=1 Tax=Gemmatirosa kalamazoonensis TaxID=861299 RepID=W0RGL7_9BACT|nr:ABC transporter permease [Gemmatirosa kalamazoonensis]AHG90219.1 ABC-type transporter, integral membrane subunit [Gemmatirosa kalamazoonensis]
MLGFVVRRLLQGVLVVFLAATAAFLLLHLAPGDPIAATLDASNVPESVRAYWRGVYGLDRPLLEQYWRWIAAAARGDLGWSYSRGVPVTRALADALPNTLLLVGTALVAGFVVGIGAGVLQASMRVRGSRGGRAVDRALGALTVFFFSLPEFWLAIALLVLFTFLLPVLPSSSAYDPVLYEYMSPIERLVDRAQHLVLPALTLALGALAVVARHQRAALLEVAREDYLRTARAKGMNERAVLLRHALRNALIPVITLLGLAVPALVGGVVFVEKVFGWPGMGLVAINAVAQRDYPLVTGAVVVGSVAVTVGALLSELLHALVDPRLRAIGGETRGRAA